MDTYKTYITIDDTKQRILSDLPFPAGQRVEVIILIEDNRTDIKSGNQENKHKQFFLSANQAYIELRNNPELWGEELTERELWEQTLSDG